MKHPYYLSPREEQSEAFREEIARYLDAQRKTPRQGVRVLRDGTVERYTV